MSEKPYPESTEEHDPILVQLWYLKKLERDNKRYREALEYAEEWLCPGINEEGTKSIRGKIKEALKGGEV